MEGRQRRAVDFGYGVVDRPAHALLPVSHVIPTHLASGVFNTAIKLCHILVHGEIEIGEANRFTRDPIEVPQHIGMS